MPNSDPCWYNILPHNYWPWFVHALLAVLLDHDIWHGSHNIAQLAYSAAKRMIWNMVYAKHITVVVSGGSVFWDNTYQVIFIRVFSHNRLLWVRFYGDLSNKDEILTPNHTHTSLFPDNCKNLFLKALYLRKKNLNVTFFILLQCDVATMCRV